MLEVDRRRRVEWEPESRFAGGRSTGNDPRPTSARKQEHNRDQEASRNRRSLSEATRGYPQKIVVGPAGEDRGVVVDQET